MNNYQTSRIAKLAFSLASITIGIIFLFSEIASSESSNPEDILWIDIPILVASPKGENVLKTVSTVSVIDKKMIQNYNFRTISEALQHVPGFASVSTYLKNRIPTVRGITQEHYANKVLIMVNNVPAWNAVAGEGELERVNINDVERIEILKGPASVLYGSNAYTGAVNIVLKKPSKNKSQAEFFGMGGGNETFKNLGRDYGAGGHFAMEKDDYSFFVSANSLYARSSDFTWMDEGLSSRPRTAVHIRKNFQGMNFTLNGRYKYHSILFNTFNNLEDIQGVVPTIESGVGKDMRVEGNLMNYAFTWNRERYDLKYSFTVDRGRRDFARVASGNTAANINGGRYVHALAGNVNISDSLSFDFGTDFETRVTYAYDTYEVLADTVSFENNMKNVTNEEGSVFAQLGYKLSQWAFLLGSRYTHNQKFGDNMSSRGTAIYEINKSNSLKLIAGQSYRSPSLFEMNFINQSPTSSVFGNSNLKPERSNSVELAYLASYRGFFSQILGYYATYENVIFRAKRDVLIGSTLFRNAIVYDNGSQFYAKGLELETRYELPKTQLFLNFDYVDGSDDDKVVDSTTTGKTIYTYNFKYVPTYHLSGGFVRRLGHFHLASNILHIGGMDGPFNPISPNYIWNANLGFSHKEGPYSLTHSITVKNITDNDINEPEYTRRTTSIRGATGVNEIPMERGRAVFYTVKVKF